MKMIVVGMDDGIILDLKRCVIFDEDAIGDADQRVLNFGTEADAISVADRHGNATAIAAWSHARDKTRRGKTGSCLPCTKSAAQ